MEQKERPVCSPYAADVPEAVLTACFAQIANLVKKREMLGEQLAQVDADLEALRQYIGSADG
jgi:hypothetical protein